MDSDHTCDVREGIKINAFTPKYNPEWKMWLRIQTKRSLTCIGNL
jgi:hypothetical protein